MPTQQQGRPRRPGGPVRSEGPVRPGHRRAMVRAAVAPLLRGSTYRRGVHMLLGGVLLLPYILLAYYFVLLWQRTQADRLPTLLVMLLAVAVAAVPPFLSGARALEITAARLLLGADLPEPSHDPAGGLPAETRLRAALWFAVHLVVGGLMVLLLAIAVPMALIFALQTFGWVDDADRLLPGLSGAPWAWSLLGIVLLIATGYVTAGLGSLAATMAPVLLGPSPTERLAALETQARQAAERNRLARELHDSVGHALTVTVLQAGAAQAVFDSDPTFVRTALSTVEEVGRAALEELDGVLALLRDDEAGRRGPTLDDLGRLCGDARSAGGQVDLTTAGRLADVPPPVSREGYRIVQEALTNAARHAAGAPVTVSVEVAPSYLRIVVTNPLLAAPSAAPDSDGEPVRARSGGRGLIGMRERVHLLGGELTIGPAGDHWRVEACLPLTTTNSNTVT